MHVNIVELKNLCSTTIQVNRKTTYGILYQASIGISDIQGTHNTNGNITAASKKLTMQEIKLKKGKTTFLSVKKNGFMMRGNPLMYIKAKRRKRILTHAHGQGCYTKATKVKKIKMDGIVLIFGPRS